MEGSRMSLGRFRKGWKAMVAGFTMALLIISGGGLERAVGIEGLQHPFDPTVDQVAGLRLVYIIGLYQRKDLGEDLQALVAVFDSRDLMTAAATDDEQSHGEARNHSLPPFPETT